LGAALGADNALYYYSLTDQSLKKATLEGKNKAVLLSNFPGKAERVVWSPRKDKALLLLRSEPGQALWHMADLSTKTLVPLRADMSRLAWNNLGDKIIYQYTDGRTKARSLNIANPDGSDWRELATLGQKDFFMAAVPKSTLLSFWSRPHALENTSFETVALSGENRKVLLSDPVGADYLWSPDGEQVLVSTGGTGTLMLALMNRNGGEYRTLSIPTLISKAAWNQAGMAVYYALPGSLPETSLLPNEYWEKSLYTQDTFWKMDLGSGKKTRLIELEESQAGLDSTDLFVTSDEDAFFFTDRKTHRLYRIDL
jgi:Tol biopolymer transport system component